LCEAVPVISFTISAALRLPDNCKEYFAAKIPHVDLAVNQLSYSPPFVSPNFIHGKFSGVFHTSTDEWNMPGA
jgi:hypothetical protein